MKKIIIILIVLLVSNTSIEAQRYLPEQKGIQITGGITDGDFNSFHTGVAYTRYDRHSNRWMLGAEFLNRKTDYSNQKVPISQFTAEGGYFLSIFSDRNRIVTFSVGLSALTGYETINWGDKILPDGARIEDRDRFIYGGAATFEIETYVTDRIVILLNVRERAMWGGDTDRFHNQIGLGIKYIIN